MRQTELVSKTYYTSVTVEDMKCILDNDGTRRSLFSALFCIRGVNAIEYGGHFGSQVWYTIDALDDLPETHRQIQKAISNAARKQ